MTFTRFFARPDRSSLDYPQISPSPGSGLRSASPTSSESSASSQYSQASSNLSSIIPLSPEKTCLQKLSILTSGKRIISKLVFDGRLSVRRTLGAIMVPKPKLVLFYKHAATQGSLLQLQSNNTAQTVPYAAAYCGVSPEFSFLPPLSGDHQTGLREFQFADVPHPQIYTIQDLHSHITSPTTTPPLQVPSLSHPYAFNTQRPRICYHDPHSPSSNSTYNKADPRSTIASAPPPRNGSAPAVKDISTQDPLSQLEALSAQVKNLKHPHRASLRKSATHLPEELPPLRQSQPHHAQTRKTVGRSNVFHVTLPSPTKTEVFHEDQESIWFDFEGLSISEGEAAKLNGILSVVLEVPENEEHPEHVRSK